MKYERVAVHDLAELIGEVVGFTGNLIFDTSKSDGTMRKLLAPREQAESDWLAGQNPVAARACAGIYGFHPNTELFNINKGLKNEYKKQDSTTCQYLLA